MPGRPTLVRLGPVLDVAPGSGLVVDCAHGLCRGCGRGRSGARARRHVFLRRELPRRFVLLCLSLRRGHASGTGSLSSYESVLLAAGTSPAGCTKLPPPATSCRIPKRDKTMRRNRMLKRGKLLKRSGLPRRRSLSGRRIGSTLCCAQPRAMIATGKVSKISTQDNMRCSRAALRRRRRKPKSQAYLHIWRTPARNPERMKVSTSGTGCIFHTRT